MSVPKYDEMYAPFLRALQDGKEHTMKELKQAVVSAFNLTEEDTAKMLPSGKQGIFDNRIGWTRTYLKKAGLIASPERAKFYITEEGKKALPDADIIDNKYLMQYESFREFQNSGKKKEESNDIASSKSPEEQLEDSYAELNKSLADDLMSEIINLSPTDFEKLVLKLLLAMGYGNGIDNAGRITKATNDGGIDGVVKEDQLGFSSICYQAKRWDPTHSVSRPEIQKFIGAIQERNTQRGLFITTATFSSGAKESAEKAGIVLVDGSQLTRLMINNNLGVSVEHVYEVKRIDSDFFEDF